MEANDSTTTIVGALFTFIAVCYASLRTSSASQLGSLGMSSDHKAEDSAVLLDDDDALEDGKSSKKSGANDDERTSVLYNWSFFHLTFALASMYLMMVLTDWGVVRYVQCQQSLLRFVHTSVTTVLLECCLRARAWARAHLAA